MFRESALLLARLREASRELLAAGGWIRDQARSMIMILETEGEHIGNEIVSQYDNRDPGFHGTNDGTHDVSSGSAPASARTLGTRSASQLLADERFRAALTQHRAPWAFEMSFSSGRISSADMTLRELAHQFRLDAEALSTRIRGTHDSMSGEPGDPASSIEHRVLTMLADTLDIGVARLSYSRDMSLVPDPFEVECNTVWNLWEQIADICTEYEFHTERLTDLGRALQAVAWVPDDGRTEAADDEE